MGIRDVTADDIAELVGVCCDGDTVAGLRAARTVVTAYESLHKEVISLRAERDSCRRSYEEAQRRVVGARAVLEGKTS